MEASKAKWAPSDALTNPKCGRWVCVVACIRSNKTGEVRRYLTQDVLMDGEDAPSAFIWERGNYSCDCNRALFFGRAAGLKDEEMSDCRCGDGGYSLNLENPATGKVYYREFDDSIMAPMP